MAFFALRFVLTIIHGNAEGLGEFIMWVTSGGHKVDVGGVGPIVNLVQFIV